MFVLENFRSLLTKNIRQKVILHAIFIIVASGSFIHLSKNAKCSDYYLVEQPYRNSLKQYYADREKKEHDDTIELSNIVFDFLYYIILQQ